MEPDADSAKALAANAEDHWAQTDPWESDDGDLLADNEHWLLGYVDMLTLMLTLLVMLLAFNQIENRRPDLLKSSIQKESTAPTPAPEPEVKSEPDLPQPDIASDHWVSSKKDSFLLNPWLEDPPFSGALETPEQEADLPLDFSLHLEDNDEYKRAPLPAEFALGLRTGGQTTLPEPEPETIAGETARPDTIRESEPESDPDRAAPELLENPETSDPVSVFEQLIAAHKLSDLVEVTRSQNSVRLEVNENILFETADSELKSAGMKLLNHLAGLLAEQPGNILIEGHTDNVPIATARYPSNWELSTSRASSVARYLIEHSIDPERLRAIGYADAHPRASNQTRKGRSKNRRVSLVIEIEDPNSAQYKTSDAKI